MLATNVGSTRLRKRSMARVSGSLTGPEPEVLPGSQFVGQFRLRSTPLALLRVPAASPSGFIVGTTHTSARFDTGSRSRMLRAVTTPAGSSPCICPSTTTTRSASGLPRR
jgi:hypothetical protein